MVPDRINDNIRNKRLFTFSEDVSGAATTDRQNHQETSAQVLFATLSPCYHVILKKTKLLGQSDYDRIFKMHVYTPVWLKSDQISFLIVELKHLDYLIDSLMTPAGIRSSGSDRILRSAQARNFFPGPWAGSRRTAASFLRNHRKKEHHCASSLCNYHVHHKQNVQRCSFVSLFIRHLCWMPRQLVT